MNDRDIDPLACVAVLGFCVISFMMGAAFTGSLKWKHVLDVATAVGTCGAVVVAMWLGTRQLATMRAESWEKAVVAAVRLTPELTRYTDALFADVGHLDFRDETIEEADVAGRIAEIRGRAFQLVAALRKLPSLEHAELSVLAPLGKNVAPRLARAFATIDRVLVDASTAMEERAWDRTGPRNMEIFLQAWVGGVSGAVDLLRVSLADCAKVADLWAPPPTPEEVWGPE